MARRPKPNHLHLVQGTGRADRHALGDAPEPPKAPTLAAPAHLTDDARAAWETLAPVLDGMGVLSVADAHAFERMVECYAEIRRCQTVLELNGHTYETRTVTNGFMVRARPEVAQLADADRRFKGWLGEFGLTPAARTKVKVNPGGKKADPLDKYFG